MQALVSEILWSETNDDYLHFLKTAVKRYDSNNAPLIYLANVVEVRRRFDNLTLCDHPRKLRLIHVPTSGHARCVGLA
jgi:hypothetical protein